MGMTPDSVDRVTSEEEAVVSLLAQAWNAFLALPLEHPCERHDFCNVVHQAQNIVLGRAGRRQINRERKI